MADQRHVRFCFAVLCDALGVDAPPADPNALGPDVDLGGLFVTWKIDGDLRGCIGSLSAISVRDGLTKYPIVAATRDPRFEPMTSAELTFGLECCVSFLIDFQDSKKWNEWETGVHGIVIEFVVKGVEYGGTYLPEVAKEQNWTREEAMESLVRKSGYRGKINDSLLESISLTTYRSSKATMSWKEFRSA